MEWDGMGRCKVPGFLHACMHAIHANTTLTSCGRNRDLRVCWVSGWVCGVWYLNLSWLVLVCFLGVLVS